MSFNSSQQFCFHSNSFAEVLDSPVNYFRQVFACWNCGDAVAIPELHMLICLGVSEEERLSRREQADETARRFGQFMSGRVDIVMFEEIVDGLSLPASDWTLHLAFRNIFYQQIRVDGEVVGFKIKETIP